VSAARPDFLSVSGPFISIASDNSWARPYDSLTDLLDDSVDGVEDFPLGQEFYDLKGNRLAPVFGSSWKLETLAVSGAQARPEEVVDRLCAVVERVRVFIEQHPDAFSDPADRDLADLPDLRDADVATCIAAFADEPQAGGPPGGGTSGGLAMAPAARGKKSRLRTGLCKAFKKKCK
jgi:hypothetical protein